MCGASSEQKQMYAKQSAFYDFMTQQAQAVFGKANAIFDDLKQAFSPIVAAGPNQKGYSDEERTALNTQAIEGTAQTYDKATKAVNESIATQGGGNAYIPSGANDQIRADIAKSAAANESAQKLRIKENDYAQGRQNFFAASNILGGATGVFNPASTVSNSTTSAGNSAADTANQIAMANNSWVNGVIGALGGVAAGVATGGMSNLGKGVGFFGGKR